MFNYDEYQIPCLKAIKVARKSSDKGLVVMAGGLGKTIIAARDIKDYFQNHLGRVLVLGHDTNILDQNLDKFSRILGREYSLGSFHGKQKTFRPVDVLFASFQTMEGKNNWKEQFQKDEFDYIIVDEAHHSKAQTFSTVIEYFEPKFLLGLTATPFREDGQSLTDFFGEPIYQLNPPVALAKGYLTPIDYNLMTYEIGELGHYINSGTNERISKNELNRKISTRQSDEDIVKDVEKRLNTHQDPRTIVFCSSVDHVESIASLIKGSLPLHSDLSPEDQVKNLQLFRDGDIRTIVVMNKFNEGIDVPEIDVIIRLRQTDSRTLFQQQLFRGTRIAENKDKLTVYDYVTSIDQLYNLLVFEENVRAAEKELDSQQNRSGNNRDISSKLTVTISGGEYKIKKEDILKLMQRVNQYRHDLTDDKLIKLLKELGKKLNKTPTMQEIDDTDYMPCSRTYLDRFGSFLQALALAGFDVKIPREYTKEELIEILQELSRKLDGKVPSIHDIDNAKDIPCAAVFERAFGDIAAAQRAAGFEPYGRKISLTREELLKLTVDFTRKNHRPPTASELQRRSVGLPSLSCYCHTFGTPGTMQKVIEALKDVLGDDESIIWDQKAHKKELRRKEVLDNYIKLVYELHRKPTRREVEECPTLPSKCGINGLFEGGIPELARLAEKDIAKAMQEYAEAQKPQLAEDEAIRQKCIAWVKRKASELGHTPRARDLEGDPSSPTRAQIKKYFETFPKMLVCAGFIPNTTKLAIKNGSKKCTEEVIARKKAILIKDLQDKIASMDGQVPTRRAVDDDPNMASSGTYRNLFGSWNEAIIAAGYKPTTIK